MEEKIIDLEMAIEELDQVIHILKGYTGYDKNIDELEMERAVLEMDLEAEQVKLEEAVEESNNELKELEREYWREAI